MYIYEERPASQATRILKAEANCFFLSPLYLLVLLELFKHGKKGKQPRHCLSARTIELHSGSSRAVYLAADHTLSYSRRKKRRA